MTRLSRFYRRLATNGPENSAEQLLLALLMPLGRLFGVIMALRVLLYRCGVWPIYRPPVPVISVGNLTVGGTGKTPVVDYLASFCLQRGRRVAVVSRGYRSRGHGVRVVSAGNGALLDVRDCGDEPWLLAQRHPRLLVLVAKRRAAAVRHAVENLGAEVILLDDGFQHLAVARDCDVVLLDARRPFGNGRVLPAGLLRERPAALRRGQLFVLTRAEADTPLPSLPGPTLRCRHRLASDVVSLAEQRLPMKQLADQKGLAFAGIAEPESFFGALAETGLQFTATLPFSDHAAYDSRDLARLVAAAQDTDYLITTEKDAVKLQGAALPRPCYRVGLELEWLEPGRLEALVAPLIHGKEGGMSLSEELLRVLACPRCHGSLLKDDADKALICRTCRLAYPVEDDIPVLLVEEARPLVDKRVGGEPD